MKLFWNALKWSSFGMPLMYRIKEAPLFENIFVYELLYSYMGLYIIISRHSWPYMFIYSLKYDHIGCHIWAHMFKSKIWDYMDVYDYISAYMDQIWTYINICDHIRTYKIIYDAIYGDIFNYMWTYMARYAYIQAFIWEYMFIYESILKMSVGHCILVAKKTKTKIVSSVRPLGNSFYKCFWEALFFTDTAVNLPFFLIFN